MNSTILPPPLSRVENAMADYQSRGYTILDASSVRQLSGADAESLQHFAQDWEQLPPDHHLRDGGRYRFRRHASFVAKDQQLQAVSHRAHWQPLDYNALHGGIERWFEPMFEHTTQHPSWQRLLLWLCDWMNQVKGVQPWFIEAHQFRIDASNGIGRPTPEGAHRDGVDLVAVFLLGRHNVKGGETRVFEAHGPEGLRFTLTEPWSLMLLDDTRVIHESTPIQPTGPKACRDTLVITLRSGGFLDDPAR